MSRRIEANSAERLKSAIPFGLGQKKPAHFRDMLRIAWSNRDNLGYAWKVLSKGVCDGCALGVAGFHDWTIDGVHLCMTRLNLLRLNTMPALDPNLLADISTLKAHSNADLRELGRLPYPMLRERGDKGFRRITWDEAYARMAKRIRASVPQRLAFFLTSRGITNEIYYMGQKVARFLGTNNVDNAARLCHSPSTGAMKYALGVAASTCSYKDWLGTDLIVFFGANPANDQPVTTKYLHLAKKLGTKVALVNPYLEPGMKRYWVPSSAGSALFGTAITDYWFPVSQGGDIAFLYGVLKMLVERGWTNSEFIAEHTREFEALSAQLSTLNFPDLESTSGLTRADMEEFAALLHGAKNAVFVWSMGITQHAFGGDAVSMILNLGLARGYVGRDKCGLMPIRGHSSVQGGAEMGAYATAFPGGKPINSETAAWLSSEYGFEVPDENGLTACEMVEASARGELDLLYCVGGNFLRTLPEPDYVRMAMGNVPMRVHQDIILTDQMFIEAREEVLLLPAKTRYEQDDGGTETTTERRIISSPEIPRQVGEAKAEWKILRELAVATFPERAHLLGCETGQGMREEIARVVPFYDGIQHLKNGGDQFQYGGPHLCADGKFQTTDGKAHFRAVSLPSEPVKPVVSMVVPSFTYGSSEDVTLPRTPVTIELEAIRQEAKACKERAILERNFDEAVEWRDKEKQAIDRLESLEEGRDDAHNRRSFVVSTRRGKQFNTLIYAEIDPLNGAARNSVLMNPDDAAALRLKSDDRITLVNGCGRFEGRVFLAPIARGNLQIHWPEGNVIIQRGIHDTLGGVPDYNATVQIEKSDA
ncbi:MAG TPA: molybdopterin-dependent oxidoreductase [Candidatus Limnocylindria bacterium]|nr:molybdopterin-dependent oxidoreductase [Candidatus Limnocylindria bacterium]